MIYRGASVAAIADHGSGNPSIFLFWMPGKSF